MKVCSANPPRHGEGDHSHSEWWRGPSTTTVVWGRVPSTKPLRVLVPLPVNGEEFAC